MIERHSKRDLQRGSDSLHDFTKTLLFSVTIMREYQISIFTGRDAYRGQILCIKFLIANYSNQILAKLKPVAGIAVPENMNDIYLITFNS